MTTPQTKRLKKKASQLRYEAKIKYRKLSAQSRPLPDFLIIGAQKCGTSSLHHYLSQHPQAIAPMEKEIRFFFDREHEGGNNLNFRKGIDWYRAHWPSMSKGRQAGTQAFESTPGYILNSMSAERIKQTLPGVKLILMVRNPTERAISHYFHNRRHEGREPLELMAALQNEAQQVEKLRTGFSLPAGVTPYSYLRRGLYAEQIQRFLEHFDRSSLHLIEFEEFVAKPKVVLDETYDFLGLEPGIYPEDLTSRNVSKNRKKVDSTVYDWLDNFFDEPNQSLSQFAGQQFSW